MERRRFLISSAYLIPLALSGGNAMAMYSESEVNPYRFSAEGNNFVLMNGAHVNFVSQKSYQITSMQLDALFLESGSFPYSSLDEKKELFNQFNRLSMYAPALTYSQSNGVPLILADLPDSNEFIGSLFLDNVVDSVPLNSAIFGGLGAAVARRPLFKGLCAAISAWGYGSLFKDVSNMGYLNRLEGLSALRSAGLAIEKTEPGIRENFRNALWAKKLLTYANHLNEIKQRPVTIGVVSGRYHEFLSEHMKEGADSCLRTIQQYPDFLIDILRGRHSAQKYLDLIEVVNSFKDLSQSYSLRDSSITSVISG